MDKKSFILYNDTARVLLGLENNDAGIIIKSIINYSLETQANPLEPKEPTGLNGFHKALFDMFKAQLDRDLDKYIESVERNRNNGKKGGRPKGKKTHSNPKNPSQADSVSVSVSVSDNKKSKPKKESSKEVALNFANDIEWIDKELWKEWIKHKIKLKAMITDRALQANVKKLKDFGIDRANLIIEMALVKGWKDFYMTDDIQPQQEEQQGLSR